MKMPITILIFYVFGNKINNEQILQVV